MHSSVTRRLFLQFTSSAALSTMGAALPLFRATSVFAAQLTQADAIGKIATLAAASDIAGYEWANRGKAPPGYIKGMAVSYAKVYFNLRANEPNAIEMAKAVTPDSNKDALKHYEAIFQQAGMDNSKDGVATLRHLFVLMLGLGMRESSGRYCEGRDQSADNTTAETAEAGLFQTSYNARHASPLLPPLFKTFMANPSPSYLDVFKEGVHAKDTELQNFGDGDGRDFQKLSKECPFFAVQFAAIGLRNIRKHWGPINRRAAEVKTDAERMFKDVEKLVEQEKLGPLL